MDLDLQGVSMVPASHLQVSTQYSGWSQSSRETRMRDSVLDFLKGTLRRSKKCTEDSKRTLERTISVPRFLELIAGWEAVRGPREFLGYFRSSQVPRYWWKGLWIPAGLNSEGQISRVSYFTAARSGRQLRDWNRLGFDLKSSQGKGLRERIKKKPPPPRSTPSPQTTERTDLNSLQGTLCGHFPRTHLQWPPKLQNPEKAASHAEGALLNVIPTHSLPSHLSLWSTIQRQNYDFE